MQRIVLLVILLAFSALSVKAVIDHGYFGIFAFHFTASAGLQVLSDLIIACTLAMFWMVADARRNGRNPWPFVALTLAGGSFGPLLYLLLAPQGTQNHG